jgi:hypothetical protein
VDDTFSIVVPWRRSQWLSGSTTDAWFCLTLRHWNSTPGAFCSRSERTQLAESHATAHSEATVIIRIAEDVDGRGMENRRAARASHFPPLRMSPRVIKRTGRVPDREKRGS